MDVGFVASAKATLWQCSVTTTGASRGGTPTPVARRIGEINGIREGSDSWLDGARGAGKTACGDVTSPWQPRGKRWSRRIGRKKTGRIRWKALWWDMTHPHVFCSMIVDAVWRV